MVQPTVTLEANEGSEGTPTWVEVTGSDELVYTVGGSGAMSQANIPFITRPASGTVIADELWSGSTGVYSQVTVYDGAVNQNQNVLRWTWDGAMNSAPIFTSYPTTAHANPTPGDDTLLGGSAETSSTSHIKACMSTATLGAAWCTPTTGSGGAITADDTGQSLQSELQYLQLSSVPSGAGNQTLNIVMYLSSTEELGTLVTQLSLKYTWT